MNKKIIAMIPAAGRGSRMLNLTDDMPKAMLPLYNRPIIGWHLEKLIQEEIKDVCIIVGYKKEKLIDYVDKIYSDKLNITYVEQHSLNGLASAIKCGIDVINKQYNLHDYKLLIILGDTIIKDNLQTLMLNEKNFIGYNNVEDYSRWCLIQTRKNSNVVDKFIDKPNYDPKTRKALIGIYSFDDINYLNESISTIIRKNITIKDEFQLSSAMDVYMNKYSINAIEFTEWFDCGEVETFNKTRKNITRFFNSITITDDNTIIKKSNNEKKIKQEINWYLNIPNKLRTYIPQLIDYSVIKDNTFYELEYVNFAPMQELFLYNLPNNEEWTKFFKNVFTMIERFKIHSTKARFNTNEHLNEILILKTKDRINELLKNEYFNNLFNNKFISINNVLYKNINEMWSDIENYIKTDIVENSSQYWQIIHGDLFFGNMLYDVNSETLKILDPRGNFGIDGTYGDIRYDIAKLMHSIYGKYDFIINDLFAIINEDNYKFEYLLYDSNKHQEVEQIFDKFLNEYDFDKKQILTLTGLLFISMIPLHAENINHQKMFYLISLQIFNKIF